MSYFLRMSNQYPLGVSHRDLALEQLEIAHVYSQLLEDITNEDSSSHALNETRGRRIADANRAIGRALKMAEIHSNLAIAQAAGSSSFSGAVTLTAAEHANLERAFTEAQRGEGVTL